VQTPSDNLLIENIRKGDIRSFERVFMLYAENLVRYATTIVKDTEEAEDIVQQLFVSIWEKKGIPEMNTSLKSYLYRSVFNTSLNKIKQIKVRASYASDTIHTSDGLTPGTEQMLEQKETMALIEQAINELPEQCRRIFKMCKLEQMRYQQIADELSISIKTVENQMGKALKHMRERLKDYALFVFIYLFY
jgi:RNA polymerase sigma-70 factor (ECF subfamily)